MLKFSDLNIEGEINIHICNEHIYGAHTHDFLELAYVLQGKAVHNLNGMQTMISKGNYFIIDYGIEHSYTQYGAEPLKVINCLFFPGFIDKSLNKCRNFNEVVNNYLLKYSSGITNISPANYIFNDDDGSVYELLEKMLDEYEKKQSGYLEIMRCRLIEIIVVTMRKNSPPVDICADKICEFIMKYAEENIAEKNILGKISKEVNFSTSYLSRKFKDEINISFSEYLQNIRIEQSCRLLANTKKKITEVAQLSGYSDMKFFNSIFKKRLGITPREFRKRVL